MHIKQEIVSEKHFGQYSMWMDGHMKYINIHLKWQLKYIN